MLVHEQLLTAAGKQACKPFGATSSAPALTAATALLCTLALWSLAYAPPGETLREVAEGGELPLHLQPVHDETPILQRITPKVFTFSFSGHH